MQRAPVTCPRCQTPLPDAALQGPSFVDCGSCRAKVRVAAFPALWRGLEEGRQADRVLLAEQASCFYHADNQAAVVCESCGRFLCSLCDVEFEGAHRCPACIEAGLKQNRFGRLANQRMVYGNLACMLAFLPLLVWPLTVLTAPVAIFVALRYWKAPGSVLGGSRWRNVAAALFAVAQIAVWVIVAVKFAV